MKWFKHDCDASDDSRIRKLKAKFGMVGYGVFFNTLELIGKKMEKNIGEFGYLPEEWDQEALSIEFGITPDTVGTIFEYMVSIGLFEKKDGRLYNAKIQKRCDEYTEKLLRLKQFSGTKSRQTPDSIPTVSRPSPDNVPPRLDIDIDKNKNIEEEDIAPAKKINSLGLTKGQVLVLLKEFPGMTSDEIKEEARKCSDYMAISSDTYTNPGLFFRGWMKKTYPEYRKKRAEEEREKKASEVLPDLTPEQIEANRQRIAEIKSKFPVKTI